MADMEGDQKELLRRKNAQREEFSQRKPRNGEMEKLRKMMIATIVEKCRRRKLMAIMTETETAEMEMETVAMETVAMETVAMEMETVAMAMEIGDDYDTDTDSD